MSSVTYENYAPEFTVETTDTGRTYFVAGVAYPSVTTVIGHQTKAVIAAWRERIGSEKADKVTHQASNVGNAVHDACEMYMAVRNDEFALAAFVKDMRKNPFLWIQFKKLKYVLDKNIGRVYLCESFLHSLILGVAGRCDMIADFDGVKTMIDYKTSDSELIPAKIEKYRMQGYAYIQMHNEIFTGESPIRDFVILSAPGKSPNALVLPYKGIIDDSSVSSSLGSAISNYKRSAISA